MSVLGPQIGTLCIHTYIYIHMYTYIYIYVKTHIYIYLNSSTGNGSSSIGSMIFRLSLEVALVVWSII